MNADGRQSERGQILVLIVLALVGMLGFTALAIDVGMIYSDRRIDQNAADAAAYAGAAVIGQTLVSYDPGDMNCAVFSSGNTQWNNATGAAISRATQNAFSLVEGNGDDTDGNHNEVWLTCEAGPGMLDHVDIHVRITKKVSTSMMHLFNQGVMINTVDSVVRVSGPEAIAMGASILALDHTCSSASGCATFDGTHNITVTNGNIISNSDLIKNGSSGTVEVNSGLITYHDDYYLNGVKNYNDGRIDPMPSQAGGYTEIEVDLTEELRARCSSYTAYSADAEVKHGVNTGDVSVTGGSPTTIHPGRYHNIENQSGKLIMLPGLYCIEDGFLVNSKGNNAVPKDGLVADNVTIFMDTGAGNFEITGNGDVLMHAPTETFLDTFTATPKPIQGLLLWHAGDNATGMVKITGTPQSDFYGSVVAPDTAIDIGGNAGPADTLAYTLQLVAETIRVHGNATINVTYDADQFFQSDTLFSQFR